MSSAMAEPRQSIRFVTRWRLFPLRFGPQTSTCPISRLPSKPGLTPITLPWLTPSSTPSPGGFPSRPPTTMSRVSSAVAQ